MQHSVGVLSSPACSVCNHGVRDTPVHLVLLFKNCRLKVYCIHTLIAAAVVPQLQLYYTVADQTQQCY